MNDVLGYSGRRCIVTGAGSGIGDAVARILVDLGAEVHTVDVRKPHLAGIASFSETDLRDPDAIARTVDAIGAVVNNLFNCAGLAVEVSERVIPKMIDGAVITSLADDAIARYGASRSAELADLGIRINCVDAEEAWLLVLLGSPRSAPVTGAHLLGT